MFHFRLMCFALTLLGAWFALFACVTDPSQAQLSKSFNRIQATAAQTCQITGLPPQAQDSLVQVLRAQQKCPENVHQFRELLLASGAQLATTQVANRGYHNPTAGSFSLFETVTGALRLPAGKLSVETGEFFFGHFTEAQGKLLRHQDQPEKGALMIELISWDRQAQVFRFYEMIGSGQRGQWFYRGDSLDIRADLADLHLQADSQNPRFGDRLRCSACHLAGGPIMKELDLPHNDWWLRSRPLPLAQTPDPRLQANLASLQDASELAKAVKSGMQRLQQSPNFQQFQAMRPFQEQLRPLFCAEEINLASDMQPLSQSAQTHLPSAALIDPRLLPVTPIPISGGTYQTALRTLQARFPETDRFDGDHAWLAPIKSAADIQAVERLIQRGILEPETVADVLAVDLLRPVISKTRCGLLKTLPATWHPDWLREWQQKLLRETVAGAQDLLRNLRDPERDQFYHREQALHFVRSCQQNPAVAQDLLKWIARQRQAVFESEVSQHPRGQIFEPGFRLVFPVMPLSNGHLGLDCHWQTSFSAENLYSEKAEAITSWRPASISSLGISLRRQ